MNDMQFYRLDPTGLPERGYGTAQVVELGFDTDRLERTVTYYLDPPYFGSRYYTTFYGQLERDESGEYVHGVVTDGQERRAIRAIARQMGYELVE